MNYRRYNNYKDSKIDWLGEIPNHWLGLRLKNTVNGCVNGVWGEDPSGNDGVVCIRVADFNRYNQSIYEDNLTYRSITQQDFQKKKLSVFDLLLEKSGGGDQWPVGFVVMNTYSGDAVCSNFISKLTPRTGYDSRYLKYLHRVLYSAQVNTRSINQTSGIQNLDSDSYLGEHFFCPPYKEQASIALFLDYETTKIDSLIKEHEDFILLLKEKRSALITHAVTKGLDPNVKMKDSGVVWLGEVPEEWEVLPIRRLFRIVNGTTPRSENPEYWDGDIVWVTPADLSAYDSEVITGSIRSITKKGYDSCGTSLIPSNSIILATRAPIGTIALSGVELCTNQGCKSLVSFDQINRYFFYQLSIMKEVLNAYGQGTTFLELGNDELKQIKLIAPPIAIQQVIATYLDKKTMMLDSLIVEANQVINLLKERRSALITDAVTGKIDVRDEVPA